VERTQCNTLQRTDGQATPPHSLCTTLHQTTTQTLQHAHCNTLQHTYPMASRIILTPPTATLCNTLQHSATHCNTLQHTATHCNTLQHTATHCNTMQHTATHSTRCLSESHEISATATLCNTLQHTHCNTLQHTYPMASRIKLLTLASAIFGIHRCSRLNSTTLRILATVHVLQCVAAF